jgi:hypothetical protein
LLSVQGTLTAILPSLSNATGYTRPAVSVAAAAALVNLVSETRFALTVPVVVIEPPVKPAPVATDVTVPVLLVLLFQVYFSPVVTNETSVPPLAAALLS